MGRTSLITHIHLDGVERPMQNYVRPGHPAGPPPGRGHRHYDPRWATRKRMLILATVFELRRELRAGRVRHCEIAEHLGTCISYVSITKNSIWGQRILRAWSVEAGEDPDQWEET